jgi:shikimate kinase
MREGPILLMGLRGSGKSTVGRVLADHLGFDFVDLDDRTLDLLRRERGVSSIAEAFERFGEACFREAEMRALRECLDQNASQLVLALGGGTPTAPGAADMLRGSGAVVVYLRYPANILASRLQGQIDARRPALTERGDAILEMQQVFDRRDPLYRSIATVEVSTEGDAGEVAMSVVRAIEGLG